MKDKHKGYIALLQHFASFEELLKDSINADIVDKTVIPIKRFSRRHFTLVLAVIVIFTTGWFLASVYAANIIIGSTNLAAHNSDKVVSAAINKQAIAYRLPIRYPDGTNKNYSLKQVGLSVDTPKTLKQVRGVQHRLGNRLTWWKPVTAQLVLTKNTPIFSRFIATETNVTVQPSIDATLQIVKGQIILTDAVTGKQYGLAKPEPWLLTAAQNMQQQPIKLQTLSVNPALTAKILEPYKTTLEKTITQPVSFMMEGQTLTLSPSQIAAWLEITPDTKSKKVDITVNSGKVLAYINSAIGSDIHPAKAQIVVNRPDGTSQILVNGVDGADITNKSDVASAVSKNLLNATGITESLTVNYQHFQTVTTGDYDKWIEVDLTNKRMYAYEHDNLVRTELVSAGAPATPTVTGQYAIYAKYPIQDMRGNNVDGSKYFQPNVKWINYFYQDYAIHGNYWRPLSYFGNINSSHGCVSLPEDEAQWMYDWAPINTPVIVHA